MPNNLTRRSRALHIAPFVVALALCSCGDGTDPTSIRVRVDFDGNGQPLWEVHVALDDSSDTEEPFEATMGRLESGHTILLVLPDAWAGNTATVRLRGKVFRDQNEVFLTATEQATVVLNTVTDVVLDLRPDCSDECALNARRCAGQTYYEVCEIGSRGCAAWSARRTCEIGMCETGGKCVSCDYRWCDGFCCDEGQVCHATSSQCCTPDCAGKCRGPDGCGSTCPPCPCNEHDDCASRICDLYGDSSPTNCVDPDEICYADADAKPASADGTQNAPYTTVSDCLNETSKAYIALGRGIFDEFVNIGRSVQIVAADTKGSAFDGTEFAVQWKTEVVDTPAVSATTPGTRVVLYGINFGPRPSKDTSTALLYANGTDLEIYNSRVHTFGVNGTDANVKCIDVVMESASAFSDGGTLEVRRYKANKGWWGLSSRRGRLIARDIIVTANVSSGIQLTDTEVDIDRAIVKTSGFNLSKYGIETLPGHGLVVGSISNVLLLNNRSGMYIGAGAELNVFNATIVNNEQEELVVGGQNDAIFFNSIIWDTGGDCAAGAAGALDFSAGSVSFEHSDVCSLVPGSDGNINRDPEFVAPAGVPQDFRLKDTSPCIDAGDDARSPFKTDGFDLNFASRKVDFVEGDQAIDMGAYEHQWPDR